MESMVYLTTGLIDSYENQDVEVESAIIKVSFWKFGHIIMYFE